MKYLVKFLALLLVSFLTLAIPASALANNGNDKVKSDKNTNAPANPGANTPGPYDPVNVGEGDNQGNGKAPDNGTVGNADGKNPPGQQPGGSDNNNGYECDGNKGVGNNGGNPAHSGCASASPSVSPSPSKSPEASKSPSPSVSPSASASPSVSVTPSPICDSYSGGCVTPPVVTPTTPAPVPTQATPSVKPTYRDIARPCPNGLPKTPITPGQRASDSLCHRPTPSPSVTAPATVKPAPSKAPVFVGPTVPPKVVPHTVSDTATVGISELPRTGTNSTALLAYVAIMLLGLGTLCYTLPVALTRVR